jgi:hypothetical protein
MPEPLFITQKPKQMKAYISILLLCHLLFSCNKSGDTGAAALTHCDLSMITLAGNYQLTRLEQVAYATGIATDVTGSLTDCELPGIYNFKPDSTATYTEPAGCNGNGTGKWSIAENILTLSFSSGNATRLNFTTLVSWNCSNLVLITHYPSTLFNNRYTLTKF